MSNYVQQTDFSAKDSLPSGDPNKRIRGSDVDGEFSALETAISSKEDAANKGDAGGYASLDGEAKLPSEQMHIRMFRIDATAAPTLVLTGADTEGFSVAYLSTGVYEVTHPYGNTNFAVTVTPNAASSSSAMYATGVTNQSFSKFRISVARFRLEGAEFVAEETDGSVFFCIMPTDV